MHFNTDMFVGNMGQSLRFGPEDDEVEDESHTEQEPTDDRDYSRATSIESVRVSAFFYDGLTVTNY